MEYSIRVGALGWIDKNGPWPISAGNGAMAQIDQMRSGNFFWIVNTYMGLMATSNSAPSQSPLDFKRYRARKDFRVMLWADLLFDGTPGTGSANARLAGPRSAALIVDDGTTPAVDPHKVGAMGTLTTVLEVKDATLDIKDAVVRRVVHPFGGGAPSPSHADSDEQLQSMVDPNSQPAEHSPLSAISFTKQHDNTVFPGIPAGERLIMNAVHRFRAGPHTDRVGMSQAKAAFHVPWVWAEILLTSLGNGRVRLRGASSIFPTVGFYLNDLPVGMPHPQATDASFPPLGVLAVQSMRIWPVLSAGAPATMPEPSLASDMSYLGRKLRVTALPWSCPGGPWVDTIGMATPH